jgi:hypothetical protein
LFPAAKEQKEFFFSLPSFHPFKKKNKINFLLTSPISAIVCRRRRRRERKKNDFGTAAAAMMFHFQQLERTFQGD